MMKRIPSIAIIVILLKRVCDIYMLACSNDHWIQLMTFSIDGEPSNSRQMIPFE